MEEGELILKGVGDKELRFTLISDSNVQKGTLIMNPDDIKELG